MSNTIRTLCIICIVLAGMLLWKDDAKAEGSDRLILDDRTTSENLYPYLDMIKDRAREITISDVVSGQHADNFVQAEEIGQKPGFFETGNWLRFEVENNSDNRDWLLELAFPLVYEIELYTEDADEVVQLFQGGARTHPFNERDIIHRHFVFDLDISPGDTKVYYMMAVGGGDVHPPILIWDRNTFIERTENEYALLGIFYGIIAAMIIYNLFLFFSLRMKSYLYYVIVITFTLLGKLSINGSAFQYLWPNSPEWNTYATPFFVAMGCIFILLFTRSFLNIDRYISVFKYIMHGLIALNATVILALFFSHYAALYMMLIATFLTFSTVLISAVIALSRGARQARFYILGWLIFLTGVFITILGRAAVLPYNSFVSYAGQGALTVEVVLLSLALADKINIMRKEKDITERKLQENQELMIQNLKQADELKDDFLAVTSHELRTPLYGMIGISETLRDGATGNLPDETKKQLSMVITSGHRLTGLVDNILELSKLKYDSIKLDLKLIDVKGIIEIVVAMSKPAILNKNIEILKEIDPELPLIQADENRLQQILHNVIENAIKYTDVGRIIISAYVKENELFIQVKDTGHGIREDQLNTIFEPFQQGEPSTSRQSSGLGIGLNITKQLVDLHNGSINVTSKVGIGSVFTIVLPVYQESKHEKKTGLTKESNKIREGIAQIEQPELFQISRSNSGKKGKILIVDDEVVNLQVLMNQLSLEEYEVLTASKGEDVFPIVENNDIDLIILDIMMPNMTGYEVCQKLRKNYSLMALPVLMLTAKNQVQDKMLSFEAGANDYLVKPCDKEELLARVKTLVHVKKLNEQLVQMNINLEDTVLERTLKLKTANENLQNIVEQRRQLLASIAHELGTPLTLIHHYIQSIHKGLIDIDDPHYSNLVTDKIKVLNRLIDDLFDLSRLESGKISLNIKEFHVYEWLEQVYYKSEFAVLKNKRKFSYESISNELKDFKGYFDEERLDQLFSNLISNAIENTDKNNGKISMSAHLFDDSQLLIEITDNGNGIAKEDLPHIFERFYRKKSVKTEQFGTGLGLALVKQIVESHKGSISVESKLNEWTTFYIMLPVEKTI